MADLPITASDNFFLAVERVTKATAQWIVGEATGSVNDIVLMINQLPIEDFVRAQLQGDFAALEAAQIKMLANFEQVAPITEGVVQSLIEVNQATFFKYTGEITSTVRAEMVKAVLGGVPRNKLVNSISTAAGKTLPRGQVKTLVETALKTFSRQVNAVMTEDMPADTKYVYIGVTDDKTRPVCLAMISAGSLDRAEIEESFPGSFVDGGGFNCRHRWAVQTDLSEKFTHQNEARVRLSAQEINPDTVQTPQQVSA